MTIAKMLHVYQGLKEPKKGSIININFCCLLCVIAELIIHWNIELHKKEEEKDSATCLLKSWNNINLYCTPIMHVLYY
jgi:hypothetical protein